MGIIDGVNVCDVCGQEVCDCGSGLMHDMEPDEVKDESPDDYSEAFWDGDFIDGGW